jgi:ribosomal protein L40E
MDAYGAQHEIAATCPACGAPAPPGAAICASCGTEIASIPASPVSAVLPQTSPAEPAPTGFDAVAAEMGSSPAIAVQQCQWCGAENPVGATRCATCNAAFARPDQDAALRRELDVRLREEQVANDVYANRHRFWRRFVRGQ